jgi:hypothetical protein
MKQKHIDAAALHACGVSQDLHWRDGLPEWKAVYHPHADAPIDQDAHMRSRAAKAAYAAAILERLDMGKYAMSADDYWAQQRADKQAMHQIFAEIDAKARRSPMAQPA